jgi:site-specific recombinase XerD
MTKPVSQRTVLHYYGNLRTFFQWLVKEDLIEASPVDRIAMSPAKTPPIQPFTDEQIEALILAARQSRFASRNEALVRFLVDTGVRASELCSIKLDQVEPGERCIEILGKGRKRRFIYYGRYTARALRHYLQERELKDGVPLFVSEGGTTPHQALTRLGVLQIIADLGKAAGLRNVRCSPHTFRHTFAVSFLRNGGNVFSLKEILGHSSLVMTNRYVTYAQSDLSNQHRQFSPGDRLKM